MKDCNKCYGTGVIGPMMNLLLRPPKEQKAYEDHVKSLQETCPKCLGKGKM